MRNGLKLGAAEADDTTTASLRLMLSYVEAECLRIGAADAAKHAALVGVDATWHLIGPLQSNKARKALDTFDVIETIDSLDLARRIDRLVADAPTPRVGRAYPVLLQVNVDADPAKAGFGPQDVEAALDELAAMRRLRVDGLMTVGRLVATPDEARAMLETKGRDKVGF